MPKETSMSARSPLRVLLLGFAGLAADQDHQQQMYLPALAAHAGFEVVGAADMPDSDVGERVATKLGLPTAPDWRQAIARADVDVVSVCVALDCRVEVVAAALRAGKHVLVDKPMARTAAECAEIAAVATETRRLCVPAHHQRFHPMIASAGRAVAAGKVGLPWNVQADFFVAGGTPSEAGELTNFALYPLDVLTALTGQRVVRVHACVGQHWEGPGAADDFALLMLTHHHGLTSTVAVGRMRPLADTKVGGLAVHRYRISGSHGVLDVDATKPSVSVRTGATSGDAWHGAGTVQRLLDEFTTAVRTGRSANPSAVDAVHVAEVLDAARVSATSGVPVDLDGPGHQEGKPDETRQLRP
jgi:predicted dehydrogenase